MVFFAGLSLSITNVMAGLPSGSYYDSKTPFNNNHRKLKKIQVYYLNTGLLLKHSTAGSTG